MTYDGRMTVTASFHIEWTPESGEPPKTTQVTPWTFVPPDPSALPYSLTLPTA